MPTSRNTPRGNRFNHERKRPRKLLLHRGQINKLIGAIQREGRTVVPLRGLFQREGPGQDRDRAGQGQAGARQAPVDQGSRLAAPAGAPALASLMPTVLITGAARGLGLEFTKLYAARGWKILACARNADGLKSVKGDVHHHPLEVTDYTAVKALAGSSRARRSTS